MTNQNHSKTLIFDENHWWWSIKIIQNRWFSNKILDFRDSKTLMVQAFSSQNMLNRDVLSNRSAFKTCFQIGVLFGLNRGAFKRAFKRAFKNRGVWKSNRGAFKRAFKHAFKNRGVLSSLKLKSGCFQTCFQTALNFCSPGCGIDTYGHSIAHYIGSPYRTHVVA